MFDSVSAEQHCPISENCHEKEMKYQDNANSLVVVKETPRPMELNSDDSEKINEETQISLVQYDLPIEFLNNIHDNIEFSETEQEHQKSNNFDVNLETNENYYLNISEAEIICIEILYSEIQKLFSKFLKQDHAKEKNNEPKSCGEINDIMLLDLIAQMSKLSVQDDVSVFGECISTTEIENRVDQQSFSDVIMSDNSDLDMKDDFDSEKTCEQPANVEDRMTYQAKIIIADESEEVKNMNQGDVDFSECHLQFESTTIDGVLPSPTFQCQIEKSKISETDNACDLKMFPNQDGSEESINKIAGFDFNDQYVFAEVSNLDTVEEDNPDENAETEHDFQILDMGISTPDVQEKISQSAFCKEDFDFYN